MNIARQLRNMFAMAKNTQVANEMFSLHITRQDMLTVLSLIDAEIERQTVKPEDVQLAIEYKDVKCDDCGMPYGLSDWLDTVLPNAQWNRMAPDGGLLCANCMVKRASKLEGRITTRMYIVTIDNYDELNKIWDLINAAIDGPKDCISLAHESEVQID